MTDLIVEFNTLTEKFGPEFFAQWYMGVVAPVLSILSNV